MKGTDATSEFTAAKNLVNLGNFEGAKQILRSFVLETTLGNDPEAKALCVIARSKIEILPAQAELRKGSGGQSLHVLARSYTRAARVSFLPRSSQSHTRFQIAAHRWWFLCHSLKWRAFIILKTPTLKLSHLMRAQRYFSRGVDAARNANALLPGHFPSDISVYLAYWHAVMTLRVHTLRYVDTRRGDDGDYRIAEQALQNAVNTATSVCKRGGERALFPNYFVSMDVLQIERYFLEATRAFRQRRWKDCASLLQIWCSECPREDLSSWRSSNVKMRLLAAQTIEAFFVGDPQSFSKCAAALQEFVRLQPVGAAARYFAGEVLTLPEKAKGGSLLQATLESLLRYFPLDSTLEQHGVYRDWYWISSLPPEVSQHLLAGRISHDGDCERARAVVYGGVEAFLGFLCDYYAQAGFPDSPVPSADIDALIEQCALLPLGWGRGERSRNVFEHLSRAMTAMDATCERRGFGVAHRAILKSLGVLSRFFPLLVEIGSSPSAIGSEASVEGTPKWNLRHVGPETIRITGTVDLLSWLKPGEYYLRPGWRRGNRGSYLVGGEGCIFPVRFTPRWDFWESEAANASLALTEGISFEHLRTAVELTKRCVDSAQKPKVAAVIVKEGRVIAEAYRGEDGTDRHAEEIAIHKCTREQLRGAIMITTLEPCTLHGRSPSVASCSLLLINNSFSKVIIGIPDPDNRIRGNGDKLLRSNNITVAYFPSKLGSELWALNEKFIRDRTKDDFRTILIPKL
jgi:pyrimidine deaminase RibD-like protein